MFFDFHIHRNHELAIEAKKMGYRGVSLVVSSKDCNDNPGIIKNLRKATNHIPEDNKFIINSGVEIHAKNPEDLKKKVKKFRKKADVILVHGGDLKINRAATEDPRIDILSHPYRSRYDSGINHVLSVKAAENSVAVEINLKYLLLTRPNQRHRVLNQFRQIVKLHRKYKFPMIINSDASSIYDLRNPKDVIALASCFGMTDGEASRALSTVPREIMDRTKIRDETILSGVCLIK